MRREVGRFLKEGESPNPTGLDMVGEGSGSEA